MTLYPYIKLSSVSLGAVAATFKKLNKMYKYTQRFKHVFRFTNTSALFSRDAILCFVLKNRACWLRM